MPLMDEIIVACIMRESWQVYKITYIQGQLDGIALHYAHSYYL